MKSNVLINTVEDNKSKYSQRDYSRDVIARILQSKIGHPSNKDYIHIFEERILPNSPINKGDVIAAEYIWGLDLGRLKGKTVWRGTMHSQPKRHTIPVEITSNNMT